MSEPFQSIATLVDQTRINCPFVEGLGTDYWLETLQLQRGISIANIGESRGNDEGHTYTLYGLTVGDGPNHVSITAGAHADEPAGPAAACALAYYLSMDKPRAAELRSRFTFYICPQVNPAGSRANSSWFASIPNLENYIRYVKREGPGDDVEFGYPGDGKPSLRPENEAVARFLRKGAPYVFHASLHSMGFAEGAWFLIEKSWVERTGELRIELARLAADYGFKLHDIQRNGDKGFMRIARGFCTTPTSVAMREHFLDAGDPGTARKFHLSSMEFIQSLGGDPLCMVSEIPNFAINGGWQAGPTEPQEINAPPPAPGSTAYEHGREALKHRLSTGDIAGAVQLAKDYGAVPVPFGTHIALQIEMVLAGLGAAIALA